MYIYITYICHLSNRPSQVRAPLPPRAQHPTMRDTLTARSEPPKSPSLSPFIPHSPSFHPPPQPALFS